jgi:hypothetical protein
MGVFLDIPCGQRFLLRPRHGPTRAWGSGRGRRPRRHILAVILTRAGI